MIACRQASNLGKTAADMDALPETRSSATKEWLVLAGSRGVGLMGYPRGNGPQIDELIIEGSRQDSCCGRKLHRRMARSPPPLALLLTAKRARLSDIGPARAWMGASRKAAHVAS